VRVDSLHHGAGTTIHQDLGVNGLRLARDDVGMLEITRVLPELIVGNC
jgi:hypothetical protein